MIPFIGTIYGLLPWNPLKFILRTSFLSDRFHPVRLRLLGHNIHLNQGPANVNALFRNKHLSGYFMYSDVLYRCFGLPKKALHVYKADTTGPFSTDNVSVEPRNRVEQRTFRSYHQFLVGSGLPALCQRFQANIEKRFVSLRAAQSVHWSTYGDLEELFSHTLLAPAVIDSIVGPKLLQAHPNFLADLSTLDENFLGLMSRLPKFLFRRGFSAQNRCLRAVKDWHNWARMNPDVGATVSDSEDDTAWGSKFIRDRQTLFLEMDGQDHDSTASQDLGVLWAAYHNTVASVFWLIVDVFRHPEILEQVRKEAQSCIIGYDGRAPRFDVDRLLHLPWVQAVYAENLRLRIHGTILRKPSQDLTLNGWVVPKNEVIVTCSTTAHMNPSVWASEARGSHPVFEFHPSRWLRHDEQDEKSHFSFDGTEGSWIPFGAGVHACPGRIFSKYQTILTLAIFVTMFDLEVTASEKDLHMSPNRFGFGILGPVGKISYRIRDSAV
ncbi:hypothetical protein SLS60_003608 [Paraconiothyrium brasiliense]|uniref:Cytochrome P450 n=1 Tax=Paraconiothyrium brasiliense TaxID=300254 RepID=A0ABR3RQM6_9PLEO